MAALFRFISTFAPATLVQQARRATQRSVKFVRWVRQAIRDRATEAFTVPHLRTLYVTL
jgi:hypothetical protein